MPPVSHGNTRPSMVPNLVRHPLNASLVRGTRMRRLVYFYSATSRRYRGAMWSIFTPALIKAVETAGFAVDKTWGETIEDRGSQITYSSLGQQAPLDEKVKWDADFAKRKKIKTVLDTLIPEFSVRLGGATSIDVTKPGIDKAYGIRKLRDILGIPVQEMIYVGDALFPGGNDYPAEQAGVISIPVKGPTETKRVIEAIIACLGDDQQPRTFEVD